MTTDKHLADDWRIRAGTALLLLALLAIFLQRMPITMHNAGRWDIDLFLDFAHQFLRNGQLYSRDAALYAPLMPVYKYPPLSGAVLVLLLRLGFSDEAIVLCGALAQLVAGFIAIVIVVRTLLPQFRTASWLLSCGLFMALSPLLEENIVRLQLETALLFLLSLAFVCLLQQRNFTAGMLIGIAAMLKMYPGLLLLYFLVRYNYRAIAGFSVACVLATLYSLLVLGLQEHQFFLTRVLPALLHEAPDLSDENVSFCCFPQLLALPPAGTTLCHVVTLLLLSVSSALNLYVPASLKSRPLAISMGYLLFVMTMVMGIPNSLWNYQILYSLPIVVIASLLLRDWLQGAGHVAVINVLMLVFAIAALHVTASITVDEKFYAAPTFIKVWTFVIFRVYTPLLLFALMIRIYWKISSEG